MDQIYKTDLNELFSYQRKGEKLEEKEKVIEIEIERLRDFKEHPFHVKDDKEMSLLKESIKNYGILSPLIVRPVLDGVYEIVSGHRRKYAAQQLGYYKLPVIIRVMNDDEAIISMVDSNLQRERIRYSEKAFAYKMKNEAMKRKGGRKKSQFDHKLKGKKTIELIGEEYGDSPKQVQRFIKITELIPELLQQLDDEMIGFNPAVEIASLKKEEQNQLLDAMDYAQSTPSLSQAQRLKKLSKSGSLTKEKMEDVMSEIKKGEISRVTFTNEQLCINVSSDKLFWCINSRSIYSVRLCLCGQYVFYGDTLFYSYKFTAKYRNRYWLRVSFMVVFNIINHSHTAAIITAVQIIRRSCSRWFFNSLLA